MLNKHKVKKINMYVHIKLRLKEVNASTTVRPAFPNKNHAVNDAKLAFPP